MNRGLLITLLLGLGLLNVNTSYSAEQSLGKLFFTPSERNHLNDLRRNSRPPEKLVKAGDNEEAAITPTVPMVTTPLSVQGFVKRTDGSSTVWINNNPSLEQSTTSQVVIEKLNKNSNQVTLKLTSTGQYIQLKPGQTYNPANETTMTPSLKVEASSQKNKKSSTQFNSNTPVKSE